MSISQQALPLVLRDEVQLSDRDVVRELVTDTGVFHSAEVDVAVELVEERLAKGPASGYEFVFAEQDGKTVGYTCYGLIPCTVASYDLYWIAVDKSLQRAGLGRLLMRETERCVQKLGGTRMYIDTSNREEYAPTRRFYTACGFELAALLSDFYAPGDDKAIYLKQIG